MTTTPIIVAARAAFVTLGLLWAGLEGPHSWADVPCPDIEVAPSVPRPQVVSLEQLKTAVLKLAEIPGFRCDEPNEQTGLTCYGRIKGYPRDVVIVVPPGYRPKEQADLVLHLNGFNYTDYGARQMNEHFGLATGLAASKRDAILVAPLSKGHCTDYIRHLVAKPAQFKNFIDRATRALETAGLARTAEPGSITITGHSGAYHAYVPILQSKVYAEKIRELYAFDSTYDHAEELADFASSRGKRFWSAYRIHKNDTMVAVTGAIQQKLRRRKVPFYQGKFIRPETIEAVKKNRVGFVVSGGDHDETFSKYFPVFLAPAE